LDLIYNCAGSATSTSIYLLRNAGTEEAPVFEPPRTLSSFGTPIKITNHGPNAWSGDVDGDGLPDLLTCVEWSVYPFYTHNAVEMTSRPAFTLSELQLWGDLDGDGLVAEGDLNIIRSFWGQTVAPGDWLHGDLSGDGFVGGADLDIIRKNWGQQIPSSMASVPEPGASTLLLGMVLAGLVLARWRRREWSSRTTHPRL